MWLHAKILSHVKQDQEMYQMQVKLLPGLSPLKIKHTKEEMKSNNEGK